MSPSDTQVGTGLDVFDPIQLDPEPLTFESPLRQKLADAALGLVLLPVSVAALGFLLLLPATFVLTVLELEDSAQDATIALVIVLGTALGLLAVLWRLGWSLRLEEDHAKLGPLGIGPKIPYSKVQFLKVGVLEKARRQERPRTVPLLIHRSPRRRYKIMLDRADAERCFEALRRRCRNAGALDLLHEDLREHIPEDPDAALSARRRFRRYWAAAGLLFLMVGAVPFVYVALGGLDYSTLEEWIMAERARYMLGLAPAILAFGWFALARAWRHHRAIHQESENRG